VEWRARTRAAFRQHLAQGYRVLTFSRDPASGRCFYGWRGDLHVREITLREIQLPLKEPFVISSGAVTTRRILLAELRDHDGAVRGRSARGSAPNYSP